MCIGLFLVFNRYNCKSGRGCEVRRVEQDNKRLSRVPEERQGLRVHKERERALLGTRAPREQSGERASLGRGQRAHDQVRLQVQCNSISIHLIRRRADGEDADAPRRANETGHSDEILVYGT